MRTLAEKAAKHGAYRLSPAPVPGIIIPRTAALFGKEFFYSSGLGAWVTLDAGLGCDFDAHIILEDNTAPHPTPTMVRTPWGGRAADLPATDGECYHINYTAPIRGREVHGWAMAFALRVDTLPGSEYTLYAHHTHPTVPAGTFLIEVKVDPGFSSQLQVRVRTHNGSAWTTVASTAGTGNLLAGSEEWMIIGVSCDLSSVYFFKDGELFDTQTGYVQPSAASLEPRWAGRFDTTIAAGETTKVLDGVLVSGWGWDQFLVPRAMEDFCRDPWALWEPEGFDFWPSKRLIVLGSAGGALGTGTNDPTSNDPLDAVVGKTTRAVLRAGEIRPVELLDIYFDPNDLTTPDLSFVNQSKPFGYDGVVYTPLAFRRGPSFASTDQGEDDIALGVDDLDLTLVERVHKAQLAGAHVVLRQVFMSHLSDGITRTIFIGKGKEPQFQEGTASWQLTSYVSMLNGELPRRMFTRACNHMLGDDWCDVDLSTYEVTGTGESGSSEKLLIDTTNLTQVVGYWKKGYVVITSAGDYKGVRRPIFEYSKDDGSLTFIFPFPVSLNGLTYEAVPGCEKTKVDCEDRYDNLTNYGGFAEVPRSPHVPVGKGR